jgi:hypothetical protein
LAQLLLLLQGWLQGCWQLQVMQQKQQTGWAC